jgi:hypothetical protein
MIEHTENRVISPQALIAMGVQEARNSADSMTEMLPSRLAFRMTWSRSASTNSNQ